MVGLALPARHHLPLSVSALKFTDAFAEISDQELRKWSKNLH
jgi:hypothetical protein